MLSHLCVIDYRVYARQASPKSFGWIFLKILLVMQRTQRNEFFLTDKKLVNKKKKKKKKEKNLKVKTIYEEYLAVPATPLSPADQPDKSVSSTQQASERAPTVALAAVLPLLPPRTQHRWAGHVVNPNVNKV